MNTLSASDLRIGNLVGTDLKNTHCTVVEIRHSVVSLRYIRSDNNEPHQSMVEYDRLTPIELTEEWLLKAGFEKGKGLYSQWYFIQLLGTEFYLRPNFLGGYLWGFDLEIASGYELNDAQPIQYLHQLQNLWKELTGNELMFKEK